MYTIKSQKDNVLLSITVLVLITASARLVAVLYLMTELEAPGSTLVLVILYGIVLLGSIFLLLRLCRRGNYLRHNGHDWCGRESTS